MKQQRSYLQTLLILLSCIIIIMLSACSDEGSVYRIQYPKFSFTPYTFSSGEETGHAEVTFLTPYDTDFPKIVEIDGKIYSVAVFNGYQNDDDLKDLTEIKVDDCIQAINSHAYENASNVTEVSIPNVLSLGTSSLPENLVSLTANADAIDVAGTRPLSQSLPNPDKLESLVITGKTRYSIDLSGLGGEESSLMEITLDADIPWPTMPHPIKEGMKFLGWFTSDPLVDPDAEYAEAGQKPSSYPITVYPYFGLGEDEPDVAPESPTITVPALNLIKIYVYGMDRDRVTFSRNEDDQFVISIDAPDSWYCKWTRNGDIDLSTDGFVYTVNEEGYPGRLQVIGYIFDEENRAVAAVLFELRG